MFDFTHHVILITGAAGNLGKATAHAFGTAGAHLVLVDHAAERLPQMFPELAGSPDHYLATGVDLTDAGAVDRLVDEAVKRLHRIDVLINTAGGYQGGAPLHETSLDTWTHLLNLNARTVFLTCHAVVPVLLKQGSGKIVNVAARAGLAGAAHSAAYSVSKSAVIRLTESLAAEVKGSSINVNCVVPGTIDTPQNRATMKSDPARWVPPQAIADVILFLASDAARAVNGAAIPVYGLS